MKTYKTNLEKIVITEQELLKLGFTLDDGDCYTLNLLNIGLPEFKKVELWTRTNWGLKLFLDVAQGKEPKETSIELPHIKHVDELQNLYFALTGIRLNYK